MSIGGFPEIMSSQILVGIIIIWGHLGYLDVIQGPTIFCLSTLLFMTSAAMTMASICHMCYHYKYQRYTVNI